MPDQTAKTTAKGMSDTAYALKKRQLMDLINVLRGIGASVEVDLPTIAVAGNQSSGKSSLIEAISGINLPRAVGTCTRVPIEVRLHQEESEWQCIIKIRFELKEGVDRATSEKPEINFGTVITDPKEVCDMIRRAQLAILNPSVDSDKFVEYKLPKEPESHPLNSKKQLSFSKDVIVLEISGPDLTDLTLVDLPGLIKNVADGDDPNSIELIEDMVKTYISKDSLILLVITTMDDIQNQAAAQLARKYDPLGERTIGVLTKVDTIHSKADTEKWLKVFKNETSTLLHGYYSTRQPDADEVDVGISFEDARAKEASFFEDNKAWNSLGPKYKGRLGTKHLAMALSDQLRDFIHGKLPALIASVKEKHDELLEQLRSLGQEPTVDPAGEMTMLINTYKDFVKDCIEGNADHEAFMQAVNIEYASFKASIWGTAPRFIPFEKNEIERNVIPDIDKMDWSPKNRSLDVSEIEEPRLGPSGKDSTKLDLDDVRLYIEEAKTRELPGDVPFRAKASLIHKYIESWFGHSDDLLKILRPIMTDQLMKGVEEVFGKDRKPELVSSVQSVITDVVNVLIKNAEIQIQKITAQQVRPFTQNEHYLSDVRDKVLARLKDERKPPASSSLSESDRKTALLSVMSGLATLDIPANEDDLPRLLHDKYGTELVLMAEVRAYWQVAYKRIIDQIPLTIDAELHLPAPQALWSALYSDLRDPVRCQNLLSEPSAKSEQREDLKLRVERLREANLAIKRFGH